MSEKFSYIHWWVSSGLAQAAAAELAIAVLCACGLIGFVLIRGYKKDKKDG